MKQKYYKPFTQEEAQKMSVSPKPRMAPTPSPGIPLWSPPTVDPKPDLDMAPPVPTITPIQLGDTAPKIKDWLTGISWCKPFSG